MLLTFCIIVYSVFGWTPQEFEQKIGFLIETVKEINGEAIDYDRLFGCLRYETKYAGILYPNSSHYPEHQEQKNDNEVRDGRKVLVVTGWPLSFGQRMEIIDLGNKNFNCDENNLPKYPSQLMAGTGGLINNETVMICGGFPRTQEHMENLPGDCFKLQPLISKEWIKVSDLAEPRYYSGSGNVVLDGGKLLVHGGSNTFLNPWPMLFYGHFYLKRALPEKLYPEEGYASTELVSSNSDASFSSAFSNQTMVYQHCNIQINSTTFMVTGGIQTSHCFGLYARSGMKYFEAPGCMAERFINRYNMTNVSPLRKTYFVNIKSGLKEEGPLLKIGRFNHGCERIEVNGASILIVAGGEGSVKKYNYSFQLKYLSSMEYLDLSKWKDGWKLGPDLPFGIGVPNLVSSLDQSSLYAIGGEADFRYRHDKKINMGILEYHCKGHHSLMKNCQWQIMDQQLNHKRLNSIAMSIPDSLANILCK